MKKSKISILVSCLIASQLGFAEEVGLDAPPTIVTATRVERSSSDVPASVTVLTNEQILSTPGQSVDEILQSVPGFENTISSSYQLHPTSSFPSMLGTKTGITSHVLVMVDGVPINDSYSGFVQWNRIPKENIEKIEIVRGGGATLWGTFALSGVINVITKEPLSDKASFEAGYGSHNTYRANVYDTLIFTDNLKVSMDYSKFKTDGFNSVYTGPGSNAGAKGIYGKTSMDADNLQIKADYKIDPTLSGYARFNYHNNSQPDFMLKPLTTSHETYSIDFGLNKKFNETDVIAASAFYNRGRFVTNNPSYSGPTYFSTYVNADASGSYISNSHNAKTDDFGGSLTWNTTISDMIPVALIGVDARQVEVTEKEDLYNLADSNSSDLFPATVFDKSGFNKGKQRFLGVFGQMSLFPTNALEIVPSFRYQNWKNYDGSMFQAPDPSLGYSWGTGAQKSTTVDDLSWRLSARYEVNKEMALRAASYKSFNAPTLDNLYRTYNAGGWYGYSNPTLKPETLYGQELGFDSHLGPLKASVTGFYNEIDDYLSYYIVSDNSGTVNDNIGKVRSKGAIFTANWPVNSNLDLNADYTYTDSKLVKSNGNASDWLGQQLALVPKDKIDISATYKVEKLKSSLILRHMTQTYGANGSTQSNFKQDSFTVVDLSIDYAVDKRVELFLEGTNIFDKKYIANNDGWAPPLYGTPATIFCGFRLNLDK